MEVYSELAKSGVFSISEVESFTGNKKTAYSLIARLMEKGLVRKIRNRMYSCVNPATGQVVANRYQIACASSDSAYVSHHTAFEYHGVANQVYYEVYVSSKSRFRDYEFAGVRYVYVPSKTCVGVLKPLHSQGVLVTNLERTVIDSIKDLDKIGGLEELLNCLTLVSFLSSSKLKSSLESYDIQVLYQKTGFILEHYMHDMHLPASFISYCKSKIGKSTRYLSSEAKRSGSYNKDWQLVVPDTWFELRDQGGEELV